MWITVLEYKSIFSFPSLALLSYDCQIKIVHIYTTWFLKGVWNDDLVYTLESDYHNQVN